MISFKQYIQEVFVSPLKNIEIDKDATHEAVYHFRINPEDKAFYEVFIGKDRPHHIVLSYNDGSRGNRGTYKLTKINANQFIILATVRHIIDTHFKHNPVRKGDWIEFDTYDIRTAKLYARLADHLANLIDGSVKSSNNGSRVVYQVHKL